MKTSSRTLIAFGAGIAALVIVTLVLVLTLGSRNAPLLPAETPAGVVQRYLLALQEKNYPEAYRYLAPVEMRGGEYNKDWAPSYDDWLISARNSGQSTWKANLGRVDIIGDTASVEVIIDVFRTDGPLGNPVNTNNLTFMLKNNGGVWLILTPDSLYWLY